MMYLQAHMTQILTVWGAVWALATMLQGVFPAGSVASKVCHVVLALSPLDFVKAVKQVGVGLLPPMAIMAVAFFVGCSATPAANSPSVDPKVLARASVSLLEDAWVASAQACLDLAEAQKDDTVRARCEKALTPARGMLMAAADGVDLWTEADQRNFPCLITSAAASIGQVAGMAGIKLPPLVSDGLSMAQTYAGKCAP